MKRKLFHIIAALSLLLMLLVLAEWVDSYWNLTYVQNTSNGIGSMDGAVLFVYRTSGRMSDS